MKTARRTIPVFSTDGNYVIGEIGCGDNTLVLGETCEGTVIAYMLGMIKPPLEYELVEPEDFESRVSEKHRLLMFAQESLGSKNDKLFDEWFAAREKEGVNVYGGCKRVDKGDAKAGDLIFSKEQQCIGVYFGDGSAVILSKNGAKQKDIDAFKREAFGRPKHHDWDEDDVCYSRRLMKLKQCMHGDDVRAVQRALEDKGFRPGSTDGKYDRRTRKAVKQFQLACGFKADGRVDYTTYKRLTGGD